MYFKLSESKQLKWDGIEENWYKPVASHFSFGKDSFSFNINWCYVIIVLAICVALYFLYKKKFTK
jgi:hypothetical protein